MAEYGVINEIGDLGLGFTPLSEAEQNQIKKENEKKDNENKDNKRND